MGYVELRATRPSPPSNWTARNVIRLGLASCYSTKIWIIRQRLRQRRFESVRGGSRRFSAIRSPSPSPVPNCSLSNRVTLVTKPGGCVTSDRNCQWLRDATISNVWRRLSLCRALDRRNTVKETASPCVARLLQTRESSSSYSSGSKRTWRKQATRHHRFFLVAKPIPEAARTNDRGRNFPLIAAELPPPRLQPAKRNLPVALITDAGVNLANENPLVPRCLSGVPLVNFPAPAGTKRGQTPEFAMTIVPRAGWAKGEGWSDRGWTLSPVGRTTPFVRILPRGTAFATLLPAASLIRVRSRREWPWKGGKKDRIPRRGSCWGTKIEGDGELSGNNELRTTASAPLGTRLCVCKVSRWLRIYLGRWVVRYVSYSWRDDDHWRYFHINLMSDSTLTSSPGVTSDDAVTSSTEHSSDRELA